MGTLVKKQRRPWEVLRFQLLARLISLGRYWLDGRERDLGKNGFYLGYMPVDRLLLHGSY